MSPNYRLTWVVWLTCLMMLALQIASWFRKPCVDVHEKIIVEAPTAEQVAAPMPSLPPPRCEPSEPKRIVAHVAKQLEKFKPGVTVEIRIHMDNVETFRSLKMRFGDAWHVWFKVPPLMESWSGDFDLVLVPKVKR